MYKIIIPGGGPWEETLEFKGKTLRDIAKQMNIYVDSANFQIWQQCGNKGWVQVLVVMQKPQDKLKGEKFTGIRTCLGMQV